MDKRTLLHGPDSTSSLGIHLTPPFRQLERESLLGATSSKDQQVPPSGNSKNTQNTKNNIHHNKNVLLNNNVFLNYNKQTKQTISTMPPASTENELTSPAVQANPPAAHFRAVMPRPGDQAHSTSTNTMSPSSFVLGTSNAKTLALLNPKDASELETTVPPKSKTSLNFSLDTMTTIGLASNEN